MKICIIKLGADGDVLRTLPLAKAIFQKNKGSEITWITKGDVATLLEGLSYITRFVDVENIADLEDEEFDALYNFDVDEEALELTEVLQASKKYGFHDDSGYPVSFNAGGEYYLNTMFDDELKKKNTKTYQEMMFEVAELNYQKERIELHLKKADQEYAKAFAERNNLSKKVIGVHMGSSSRWPSKAWHPQRVEEFIRLAKSRGFDIILFGGPNEIEKHSIFAEHLENQGLHIYRNDPHNSKREFAALVSLCNYMVCNDSFSLHVALGLGVKTIALFFVTSPLEVETYEVGTKIISPLLPQFFPERSDEYNEELVKSISAEEVMAVIDKLS